VNLSTAADMAYRGRCRLSMRFIYRAPGHDKWDTPYFRKNCTYAYVTVTGVEVNI